MKTFTVLFCLIAIRTAYSQNEKEAIEKLSGLEDQYDKSFDTKSLGNETIILSVPTTNEPFRVYDKLVNTKLKPNVVLVGGFGNAGGHGGAMPLGHLKGGFVQKYGKEYMPILLDGNSDVAKALGVKGHSIVIISKGGKVLKKVDFGNKIDDFMKAVEEYKSK